MVTCSKAEPNRPARYRPISGATEATESIRILELLMTKDIERRLRSLESRYFRQQTPATSERIRQATADPFVWVTEYAKTYNEHWIEEGRPDPYEHFPPYEYIKHTFDAVAAEHITWFEKSRDMMLSWTLVAYLTLEAMKTPSRGVLFQTQKEDKVIQLVDYAKCLVRTQPSWLQEAFPLKKPIEKQPKLELRFANGSYIAGIPGGADQIRSYHPWGYLNDESSFQPEAGECYNEALAVVKGKIIFNRSAGPGWYADARHDIVRANED
jgi:hypothetical protein